MLSDYLLILTVHKDNTKYNMHLLIPAGKCVVFKAVFLKVFDDPMKNLTASLYDDCQASKI